jgi:hypothetical protein
VAGCGRACPIAGKAIVIASVHKQQKPRIFLPNRVFLWGGIFLWGIVVSGRLTTNYSRCHYRTQEPGRKMKFDFCIFSWQRTKANSDGGAFGGGINLKMAALGWPLRGRT